MTMYSPVRSMVDAHHDLTHSTPEDAATRKGAGDTAVVSSSSGAPSLHPTSSPADVDKPAGGVPVVASPAEPLAPGLPPRAVEPDAVEVGDTRPVAPSTAVVCGKPMHKACGCIRPAGHDGPCNCRYASAFDEHARLWASEIARGE